MWEKVIWKTIEFVWKPRCTEHPSVYSRYPPHSSWYPPVYWTPPVYLWYPPNVLMISPRCAHGIPRCTEHPRSIHDISPYSTISPWCTTTPQCTAQTLRKVGILVVFPYIPDAVLSFSAKVLTKIFILCFTYWGHSNDTIRAPNSQNCLDLIFVASTCEKVIFIPNANYITSVIRKLMLEISRPGSCQNIRL